MVKTYEQYFGYLIREKTKKDKDFIPESPFCICTIYDKKLLLAEDLTYEEAIHDIHVRVKKSSGCNIKIY